MASQSRTNQSSSMTNAQGTNAQQRDLQGYVDQLVGYIQQLRQKQGIAENEPISTYLTNTEIVRSILKQYREYIEEKTNTADLVQVNVDAGNPMPENLPHTEFHIGDQIVTIAISESGEPKPAQK